jgi:ssDNA-binding Zn-finger/Zn-ribbon topoisomerase 1
MNSRHWPSHAAWLHYHLLEGFRVGECHCCICNHVWWAAIFPETLAGKLECPRCHQSYNWFTEVRFAQ